MKAPTTIWSSGTGGINAEKARAKFYDLDEDEVKAHLSLDNVLKAQFAVAKRLFGISFTARTDIPVYHPDVRVWK